MSSSPHFPPAYRALMVAGREPFLAAMEAAQHQPEDGLLLWSPEPLCARVAVVLEPADPAPRTAPLALVAMVGLGDALGALVAPEIPVTFDWPDRIYLNGGLVGGVRAAIAPTTADDEVPAWMVIGCRIEVAGEGVDPAPGERPDLTSLFEEGSADISATDVIDAFARHFLLWINRWQEDGFGPVAREFMGRAEPAGLRLDSHGNLIGTDGTRHLLTDALQATARIDAP